MYWIDFFLCFYLGFFGIHKFKEKRYGIGILYLCTFGLFGIGWLIDCVKLFIRAAKHTMESRNSNRAVSHTGDFGNINSYCNSCGKYLPEQTSFCPYCGSRQIAGEQSIIKNAWFWVAVIGAVFNTTFVMIATSGDDTTVDSNNQTEIVETQELPEWAGGLSLELASEIEAAFIEIGENPENISTFEYVESKDTALYVNNHYKVTFYFPWKNTKEYRLVTEDWFEGQVEKTIYPYGYVSTIEFWTDDDTSSTCYWSHYGGGKYQESVPHNSISNREEAIESRYKVIASELITEIRDNPNATGEKYNGQWVEISGIVQAVSDGGIMRGYYIYSKPEDFGPKIICWVDDANDPKLGVGDKAVFEGIVREVSETGNTEIAYCIVK